MVTGGGGGNTPLGLRVDRLVATLVQLGRRPGDIWGQRQLSESGDGFLRRETKEPHSPVSVGQYLEGLYQSARAQLDLLTGQEGRTRLPKSDPRSVSTRVDQQNFGWGSGAALTQEPGVPNPRGIQNQKIAGSNQRREFREGRVDQGRCSDRGSLPEKADPAWQHAGSGKMAPVGRALPAVISEEHQQFAAGAVLQRLLGDELGREFVVEVCSAEGLRRQRSKPAGREA